MILSTITGGFTEYRPGPVSLVNTTAPVPFQNGIGHIRQFGAGRPDILGHEDQY
jgi:hypothetical protein